MLFNIHLAGEGMRYNNLHKVPLLVSGGLGFELGPCGSIAHHTIQPSSREGRKPSSCSRSPSYWPGQPAFTDTKQVEGIFSRVYITVVGSLSPFQGMSVGHGQWDRVGPAKHHRNDHGHRLWDQAVIKGCSAIHLCHLHLSLLSSPIMQVWVHVHGALF